MRIRILKRGIFWKQKDTYIVIIDSLRWGRRDGHFAFLWLVACVQSLGLFALPLGVIGRLCFVILALLGYLPNCFY